MDKTISKTINTTFNILFFLAPLVVLPLTSELFEFNKIVLVYLTTVILTALWVSRMIVNKKILFRRTILDIPLTLFLVANVISLYFSIDRYTSLLGYYSRFNGGFLSTLSYSLLYWIYVSNVTRSGVILSIKSILASSLFVSGYAILQHFGIDKDLWEQDVQNRVFSSIGQPNWLAAWIVSIIPMTWGLILAKKKSEKKDVLYYTSYILSFMLFLSLLYTKSRSGILGFAVALGTFFGIILFLKTKGYLSVPKKDFFKSTFLISLIYLFITFTVGTPWTPGISDMIKGAKYQDTPQQETVVGPALETGGTDSGVIRKIVWQGAYDIWKGNPLFGTGIETFAYSYYKHRPVDHNLVSEWDFLYNKAHNEYLNYLATIGLVGFLGYLILITSTIVLFSLTIKNSIHKESFIQFLLPISFLSGFLGVLITNIFGFSVVLISLNLFLLPAFAVSLNNKKDINYHLKELVTYQKVLLLLVVFIFVFISSKVFFYWYSDLLYANAKEQNSINDFASSKLFITEAINYQPYQAVYYDELADTDLSIALYMYTNDELEEYEKYKKSAISSSNMAMKLSPYNMNIRRNNASLYLKLSAIDKEYLPIAAEVISDAIILAPTDAKLYYNLGVVIAKMGMVDEAVEMFKKTINMKQNYKDARFALGILYTQQNDNELAKEQFTYILEKIAPNDKRTQEELDKI